MAYEDRRPSFNISGVLSAGVSALDTSITSTAFASLPTIYNNTTYLPLTLANDAAGKAEIVYVVGHATGSQTVSVVRGREGTTAQAFSAGDVARCTPTPRDVQKVAGHAGQVGSFTSLASGGVTVPLALQESIGGVTLTNNRIVAPVTGLYRFGQRLYVSGSSNYFAYQRVYRNGSHDTSIPTANLFKDNTNDYSDYVGCLIRLAAGDGLGLNAVGPQGSVYGSTGYDGGYIEIELVLAA